MPTDFCPDTGALRGGRGASLSPRRARRRLHQHRARRARARRTEAGAGWPRGLGAHLVEHVALDPPTFAGYVREFVPDVGDGHPLRDDLARLLDAGIQRVAYDHARAFTNPTFPGRRRRKRGAVPVHTLRRLHEADWRKLPARLREWFEVERHTRWTGREAVEWRRYRFRSPGLYRLRVRQLWVTHRAVPTDAARERQSAADRYWWKAPDFRDRRYVGGRSEAWWDAPSRDAERRRQARAEVGRALAERPGEAGHLARVRL